MQIAGGWGAAMTLASSITLTPHLHFQPLGAQPADSSAGMFFIRLNFWTFDSVNSGLAHRR